MNTATQIINTIKAYDSTYCMSDDKNVYSDGKKQESGIHTLLENASNDTLIEVRNSIDLTDRFLSAPFGRYFEGLTETVPVEKPKSKLSQIMSNAWGLFKAELFNSFSEALKAAWRAYKIITQLKNGIARFSFINSKGLPRDAVGTLRKGNFEYKSKGSKKKPNPSIIKFYDVVADGWRSCRVDRIIAA